MIVSSLSRRDRWTGVPVVGIIINIFIRWLYLLVIEDMDIGGMNSDGAGRTILIIIKGIDIVRVNIVGGEKS